MDIKEKIVFVTEDGIEHDTKAEACHHEEMLKLAKELYDESDIYWRENVSTQEVAAYLLKHYVMIPKNKGGESLMLKHLDVLKKTLEKAKINKGGFRLDAEIKELIAALTYFDILIGKLV